MTAGRRGVATTPMEVRADVLVRAARLADELGYETFSVAEGWTLDATVLLAELAAATSRITISAGVLSVWGRTAATIAMSAATLQRLSGGRFILGLGASSGRLVEGFHGIAYERPARRLREVTAAVRSLLAGEPARHPGRPDVRGIRLGQRTAAPVPIWVAATGEHTMRVARDLADGWCPFYLGRDRCREAAKELAAGRPGSLGPLTAAAGPFTVVCDDPAAARTAVAACTAWYLTSMGEIYPRLVAGQGFGAEVDLIRAANAAPRRQPGVVPEAAEPLLAEFAAYGTADAVRQQLERWDEAVDITTVGLPPGLPWPDIEATLRACAP